MEKHMFCIHKIISSSLIISKKILIKMYTIQPRLKLYTSLVGSYDLIDKYEYSKTKFLNVSYVRLNNSIAKLTNKNLLSILFQEFSTNQRFNFFTRKKISFLKKFYLTLRNYVMYCYLEFLINSDLLINRLIKKTHISFKIINSILSPTTINFYVNFLDYEFDLKKGLKNKKIDFNFKNSNLFLNGFLSYLYLS